MKKAILPALMLLWASGAYAQQPDGRPLSLDEAMRMTLTENPEIKALGYEREAAVQQKKAAAGLRAPKIDVAAAYSYMGKDIDVDFNALKPGASKLAGDILGPLVTGGVLPPSILGEAQALMGADWAMTLQERQFGTVGGTVTLPVFTGGKINAANNAARLQIDEVDERGAQTRNALVSQLTERYFGLALALQVVEVRKQVLEGMEVHLEDAKALEANGIIARGERLYAEMHVAEAQQEYIKAKLQVETLRSALNNTLNTDEVFVPVTSMFLLREIEPVDHFKALAANNNPIIRQVGLKHDLAKEGVRLQRADFMPQVALMGGGSFYNYKVSKMLPRWAVGAGIKLSIFDGLSREHKFTAAKRQVQQVAALGDKADKDISVLIEKLYNEMRTYNDQMPSIDAAMEFATEYLRIKDAAFREGMAPASDVVDAELNLARIRTERLQAAYYYDLMLARLLEAAGVSGDLAQYSKRLTAYPVRFDQ